jgi:predicted protein tyrosine phosphatase
MTDTKVETLSEKIRQARFGAVYNPYQGEDKRVLFVCSMGILRSATGSRIYGHKYNTRSAGSHPEALTVLTDLMLKWANEIVFVNSENYNQAAESFDLEQYESKLRVLNIPDNYEHMHPEIIKAFQEQYEPLT